MLYWEPGLTDLGRHGLIYADLDGDGAEDLLATTGSDGAADSLVVLDGATLAHATYDLPQSPPVLQLGLGDFDGDGIPEVLVGMPTYGSAQGDDLGLVVVLHAQAPPGVTVSAQDYVTFGVVGSKQGDYLGAAALLEDLDGDGFDELVVSAPGVSGTGAIYTFDNGMGGIQDVRTATATWHHEGKSVGLGVGLAPVEVAGVAAIAIATCDGYEPTGSACTTGGDLFTVPADEWRTDTTLTRTVDHTLFGSVPSQFFAADIGSPDVVAHISRGQLQTVQAGTKPATVQTLTFSTYEGHATLVDDLTGDAAPDWLVEDTDEVLVISDLSTSGAARDLAVETYGLADIALGAHTIDVGDLDGDGCEDALTAAASEGAIYLLPGPCAPPDTGDTGRDTGDTGDTGGDTADTGDTGDTTPPDTGDTAPTDTGPTEPADTGDTAEECQEEFGWECATARGLPGWWAWLAPLIVVVRRRT